MNDSVPNLLTPNTFLAPQIFSSWWPEGETEPTESFRIRDADVATDVVVRWTGLELIIRGQPLTCIESPLLVNDRLEGDGPFTFFGKRDCSSKGFPTTPGLVMDTHDGKLKQSLDGVVWSIV